MPTINLGSHKKREKTFNKSAFQSFYQDRRWKRLRKSKITNNPLCEKCAAKGVTRTANEVHHIIPIDIYHPDEELIFDYDNLESVCYECHKEEQMKLKRAV